jgi:hypothetical protein
MFGEEKEFLLSTFCDCSERRDIKNTLFEIEKETVNWGHFKLNTSYENFYKKKLQTSPTLIMILYTEQHHVVLFNEIVFALTCKCGRNLSTHLVCLSPRNLTDLD